MATANTPVPGSTPPSAPGPAATSSPARRAWPRWRIVLGAIVAALGVALALGWQALDGYAQTGAAYGARVACACRFIGGRGLKDCARDFEPGMALIALSEDAAAKSVTARFPLLARQTASYREGWGCRLEKWGD